jgi:adhesin transport system outer membrane protein
MKIGFLCLSLFIITSYSSGDAQKVYGLKDCISIGLEKNFSILVAKNSETISNNNYTIGNAGYLPSLDLSGRYGGTLNNTQQNLTDGTKTISNGVNNTTTNAGMTLGWTIFNGFSVQTNYKKLDELRQL